MIKVCFVCLGNICRSPMAEFLLKDFVQKKGESDGFYIVSKATSAEEEGNPVYPPARAELKKHGIETGGKRAVRLSQADYERYDYFLCMEERNVVNAKRIFGGDKDGKVKKLLDFAGGGEIADPWWTGDFSRTYDDISRGIEGFYAFLKKDFKKTF